MVRGMIHGEPTCWALTYAIKDRIIEQQIVCDCHRQCMSYIEKAMHTNYKCINTWFFLEFSVSLMYFNIMATSQRKYTTIQNIKILFIFILMRQENYVMLIMLSRWKLPLCWTPPIQFITTGTNQKVNEMGGWLVICLGSYVTIICLTKIQSKTLSTTHDCRPRSQ